MRVCPQCFGLFGPDQAICPKDGNETKSYVDVLLGMTLGPYFVRSLLGEGGMGVVYEAEHTTIGRLVALKVLRPELSLRDDIVERFVTEARAVNTIGHPNIVNIYDFGKTPFGSFFIVMEHLEGVTVRHLLDAQGPQPLERLRTVVIGVGAALAAAHAKGFVHRDVKPENIVIINRQGQEFAKLLDFGIVKLLTQEASTHIQHGAGMGTPQYMSPEQLEQTQMDPRVDVYALGAVAYEMLTGMVPFPGKTQAEVRQRQLTQQPPPPSACRPELLISRRLDAAVIWALELDPAVRCRKMEELVTAVEAGCTTTLAGTRRHAPVRPTRRRWSLLAGAAVALLAVVTGAATAIWLRHEREPRAEGAPPDADATAQAKLDSAGPERTPPLLSEAEAARLAQERVAAALQDSNPSTRLRPIEHAGQLRRQGLLDELVKHLQDPDPNVRRAASRSLGRIGDQRAIQPLRRALADSVGFAAFDAAGALALLGDREGSDRLRRALKSARNELEKKYILHALGQAGDRAALAWRKLIDGERLIDSGLRHRALGYLAAVGDKGAGRELSRIASEGDWPSRLAAAEALALSDRSSAASALGAALREAPPAHKLRAATRLAEFRDARALATLLESLRSANPTVRRECVIGLGHLENTEARQALAGALGDEAEDVAIAAAVGLFPP